MRAFQLAVHKQKHVWQDKTVGVPMQFKVVVGGGGGGGGNYRTAHIMWVTAIANLRLYIFLFLPVEIWLSIGVEEWSIQSQTSQTGLAS